MSDVRLLLKAKREEARITHPLAGYSSSGQLRCTACGTTVKHSSAWLGHLGTKLHRASIARLKEEEEISSRRKERTESEKRKVEDGDTDSESSGRKKRKLQDVGQTSDIPATTVHPSHPVEVHVPLSVVQTDLEPTSITTPKNTGDLDLELELFQKHVVQAFDHQELYNRASLVAEPELIFQASDGIPSQQHDESQAITSLNDEGIRRLKEQDERELIMDRLMEEEKAQEEADAKVILLKRKIDVFKQERRLAKAKHNSVMSSGNTTITGR